MVYLYKQCLEKYGTDYKIKKELEAGALFLKEKGIYSDKEHVPELEIIAKKYPNGIFTLQSAFYYHGLTDVIPEYYYLATTRGASQMKDPRVKQIFENSDGIGLGKMQLDYNGTLINIYDKERMLIELIRSKNKLPFDYYKEIINNYRSMIMDLDLEAISEYAYHLPKMRMVLETLQKEVF